MLGESVGVSERSIGSLTFPWAVEDWAKPQLARSPTAVNMMLGPECLGGGGGGIWLWALAKTLCFSLFHHIIPIPGIYLEGVGGGGQKSGWSFSLSFYHPSVRGRGGGHDPLGVFHGQAYLYLWCFGT